MDTKKSDFAAIRRQYGALGLDEHQMAKDPIEQAKIWLAQAYEAELTDPTAMVLSTVDSQSRPDARVVLLKDIQEKGFVFFTHYESQKGLQLQAHPYAALTFYWSALVRQIRIRGPVTVLDAEASDAYFSSRPYLSRLSACASPQSHPIPDRAFLETAVDSLTQQYPEGSVVPRPSNWGGYLVKPAEVEFWQGRDDRLHDRVLYRWENKRWVQTRLAP